MGRGRVDESKLNDDEFQVYMKIISELEWCINVSWLKRTREPIIKARERSAKMRGIYKSMLPLD
jgi:hypothetical protein